MSRQIAFLSTVLIILYLFWVDSKSSDGKSKALWIPFCWMFIVGSRYVSHWLNLNATSFYEIAVTEGSPIDRLVFSLLIFAGLFVLIRRSVNWNSVFKKNLLIWAYFFFGFLSIIWSDYSFVSLKRWIKSLGTIIMVLVIITEEKPFASLQTLLRRLAFVSIPLSFLFVKYYPQWGRDYHMGQPMFAGIATQKNGLGQLCLYSLVYFSWHLIVNRPRAIITETLIQKSVYFIILPMSIWLLIKSNSATSIFCVILAISIFLTYRLLFQSSNPRGMIPFTVFLLFLAVLMEYFFGIKNLIITSLGRTPDLTTRVPMWQDLLTMVQNPLVGTGFESFWLGSRRFYIQDRWAVAGQAHNGYLEMYLNLGIVGLFFVAAWLLTGFKRLQDFINKAPSTAVLHFAFLMVIVFYNWTEATFNGINNMILLMFFIYMSSTYDVQETEPTAVEET